MAASPWRWPNAASRPMVSVWRLRSRAASPPKRRCSARAGRAPSLAQPRPRLPPSQLLRHNTRSRPTPSATLPAVISVSSTMAAWYWQRLAGLCAHPGRILCRESWRLPMVQARSDSQGMNSSVHLARDRFHDECGVVGVFGHPEASKLAYLALYALQHRGQEAAGIVSSDVADLHVCKSKGLVEEIFTPEALAQLPGEFAIGHTRYSTAGDTSLSNAQPILIDCNKGKLALGHNGNLTNANELRRKLEHRGSIFQSNSDTEVIIHLVARSAARNLPGAIEIGRASCRE